MAQIKEDFMELPELMRTDLEASIPMQEAYNERMIALMRSRPVYKYDADGNVTAILNPASAMANYKDKKKSLGTYPTKTGEILVTPYQGSTSIQITGHAAIVYSERLVIEAILEGVVFGANDWDITKKLCYGGRANNSSDATIAKAGHWCNGIRVAGAKYSLSTTLNNNDYRKGFYCSQLVYNGYRHGAGILLSNIVTGFLMPMDLLSGDYASGTYIEWEI